MANIAFLDAFMIYLQNPRNSNGNFAVSNFILETSQDNIVAYAAGGQANATPITAQTSRITTAANTGASVQLPNTAQALGGGLEILIVNHGANPVQVFGAVGTTDNINDASAATGVSQMQNSIVVYTCATPGQWYSIGLGEGFTKGLPTASTTDNITALGTNQATAYQISSVLSRFSTVSAVGGVGAVLPASAPGLELTIMNAGANPMTVYGAGTDTLAVGAAPSSTYSLAAGHTVMLYSASTGTWHGIFT